MNVAALNLNFAAIAPAVILSLTAILVMLVDAFSPKAKSTASLAYLSIFGVTLAGIAAVFLSRTTMTGFSDMISHDAFASFGEFIVCIAAGITLLTAERDMENEGLKKGEYYMLLLAATSGMAFMMSASDLVLFFLGLELMSIPIYALVGFNRYSAKSAEGSLKYFILGAFATGFLLYGTALVYGAVGSTNYLAIAEAAAGGALIDNIYFAGGMVLILSALAFKVAAVPFHMWAPDVYEGAPVSITGFMAAGVKAAAFIAFARFLFVIFGSLPDSIYYILWGLAALTMVVGNLLALVQNNIKRMLAYSSVGHAGYLLVALATGSPGAASSMLFYLLVYALSTLGAFAIITAMSGDGKDADTLEHWAGVGFRRPFIGAAMTIFMLSLAGIPPTAGFFGKFYIFKEAVERGLVNLAITGMVASVIGVYYYLRVIVYLYMQEETAGAPSIASSVPVNVGLAITSIGVVFLGVAPVRILEIVQRSVVGLFS